MKAALLKLFSINTLIAFVLRVIHGISPSQWQTAVSLVKQAEREYPATGTGAAKRDFVLTALKTAYYGISAAALNALIEMAVSYLRAPKE